MADRDLCGIFWSPEGVGSITMPWRPHLNLTALQKSHFLGPLYWELGLYSRNWGGNIQNITSFNISCFIILLMWIKMTFLLQSGKFLKSQCFFHLKMFQSNIWYQGKEALTEIWTRCGCCILPLTPTPSPAWKVVVFYSNNRLCFCLCSVFPWRPEASVGVPRVWIKGDCKLPSVDSGSESVSSGWVVWALNCSAMPLILLLGGAFDQCLFIVYRVFVQELFPKSKFIKNILLEESVTCLILPIASPT